MPFDGEPATVEPRNTMVDVVPAPDPAARGPEPELVSPELALVSPELRERARLRLPDRPWEAFAPPLAPPRKSIRTEQAMPPETVLPPRPAVSEREASGRRRVAQALVAPAVLALVMVAISWASEQTPQPGLLSPDPTTQAKPPAPPRARTAGTSRRPLPSGGYVFGGGLIVADRQGRAVTLTFRRGCASGSSTAPARVTGGRFRFEGRVRDGIQLRVEGWFVNRETAQLTILLRGPGCPSGAHAAVARLS